MLTFFKKDRVNVEMMTHIEGPIVDSFYDMALLSWSAALEPPFPLLSHAPSGNERLNQYSEGSLASETEILNHSYLTITLFPCRSLLS